MAISYLTGINLNGNELQNAQIHVCAGLGDYPEHPVDGQIIYDSNAQLLKVYKVSGNSGSWSSVGEPLSQGNYISISSNAISVNVDSGVSNGDLLTIGADGNTKKLAKVTQLPDGTTAVTQGTSVSNGNLVATVGYVNSKFGAVDALQYKGTIDGGSTGSHGALTVAANKGDVYKVSAQGKIDGVSVEVGDMLICNADETPAATTESGDTNYATVASRWDFIQRNIDGAVTGPASSTDEAIALFDGTSGKVIKNSGVGILGLAAMCRPVVTNSSIAFDAVTPSVTVSFSGTYLSSYVTDENGELVMVKTEIGSDEVTFTCDQNPSSNLICYVVALPG